MKTCTPYLLILFAMAGTGCTSAGHLARAYGYELELAAPRIEHRCCEVPENSDTATATGAIPCADISKARGVDPFLDSSETL